MMKEKSKVRAILARPRELLQSILASDETEDTITLRAASEKGTVKSAVGLYWVLWRHTWIPHRWYEFDKESSGFENPCRWGWRWHRRTFWVKERGKYGPNKRLERIKAERNKRSATSK